MFNNFLRLCTTLLSFFYSNNLKGLRTRHKLVMSNLKTKIKMLKIKKSLKLKTHRVFSEHVYKLIKENQIINFLRNSSIQNIFFVHNRLFIYKELLELTKDKKWKLWKKLIIENPVGDPVRYFLYPQSSGNRIRQVYHLKKYFDFSKINFSKIKYILEIGGGYGCMAQIFKKLNKKCTYIIFDTIEVNLLQFYYLNMNNVPVVINKIENNKVCLINQVNMIAQLNKKIKYQRSSLLIANWSISEMPIKLRNYILKKINFSYDLLISFQEKFEKINNIKYFFKYKNKLKKNYTIKIEKLKYYKKNFLNNNSHYYFFAKKTHN